MINKFIVVFILSLTFFYNAWSQCPAGGAIFVNEVFNEGGQDEWVELVVVGDPAAPTAPVDLTGWIFDDNNFPASGNGNAAGHLVFDNATFSSVNPGAIIVIYDELNEYPGLPANNPPWLYVVASSDLDGCQNVPNISDASYTPCDDLGGLWSTVYLRNDGDVAQTRFPSTDFYHGVKWGTCSLTGDTDPLEVVYQTVSLDCGSWFDENNYIFISETPGEANTTGNQLLINSIKNGTIDCNNIDLSCVAPCPEIDLMEIISSPICDYEDFILRASGLANMGQGANGDKDFGIDFVYFSGSVPPGDAYVGGITIEDVDYIDLTGVDPNQVAEKIIPAGTLSPGTYTICAILLETSANGCKPQECEVIVINESPTASLDGESVFCPEDCHQINTTISGGTEPYTAYFELSIGSFNIPFNVPAYDTNDEITICYSGSIGPYWDSGTQTFYVPTSLLGIPFTGNGTITMTALVDANGCSAENIDPNFMTLIFKDELAIFTAGPLEECDYDFDGEATFTLSDLDVILTNGEADITVNWFEDAGCLTSIGTPGSFTTPTTTVYVYLSDDTSDKCDSDTLPINLIVLEIPDPGEPNEIDVCNTPGCVDFGFYLGTDHETGGIWIDLNGSGVDLDFPYCVEFTDVTIGKYEYSYTTQDIDGKCTPQTVILTVNVKEKGNAGNDYTETFCGAPIDLLDLELYLGTDHISGGDWSNSDGIDISNPNSVDMSGEGIGKYDFYYTISNDPCDDDEAIITIEIIDKPDAGKDNELYVCNSGVNTVVDIDAALGAHDSNGDWYDLDTSKVDLSSANYVDFNGVKADTFHFRYYIPDNGLCLEDSAFITVYVQEAPYAGSGGSKNLCFGTLDTFNLYDYLGSKYDTIGIWSQIGGTPINISRPDTMLFDSAPLGIDTFIYVTSGNCGKDTAKVLISIAASPSAGDDYGYSVCVSESISLFDSLKNSNIGGTWFDSKMDTVKNFNDVILDELKTYTFKYILPDNGTCLGDTAEAIINTEKAPEAGTGEDFSVCENSINTIDLFDHILGDHLLTGVWKNENGVIIANPDKYSFNGYSTNEYTFKYSVDATAFCPGDETELKIFVVSSPKAGDDNTFTLCNGEFNSSINLDSLLGIHDSVGKWINVDNVSVNLNNSNKVLFKGVGEGSYEFKYKIDANETCPSDSAKIIINILRKLDAGTDKVLTYCEGTTDLISIITELKPESNISYKVDDLNNSGALITSSNNIDLSKLNKGNYIYQLVTGIGDLCGTDTSDLKITIVESLNAGSNNSIDVCNDDSKIDLTDLLGTHDNGGNWEDIDNSGIDILTSGGKDVSFEKLKAGKYNFKYKIEGNSSCPESVATIEVNVKEVTFGDYSTKLCSGQVVKIGNSDYSLENPIGMEVFTNVNDCDSIVSVSIKAKIISSSIYFEDENCLGYGKFILENMEDAKLPVNIIIKNVGEYTVTQFPFEISNINPGDYEYSIIDSDGCESDSKEIFTIEKFSDFSINTKVTKLEESYKINVETDIVPETILWTPSTALSCNDCLSLSAKPETDIQYIIKIMDKEGCEVLDTITLKGIERKDVFVDIPNVFTPNNDGYNEYFYVKSDIQDLTYSMYIFNRWGEKVFYADKLKFNDESSGWDGLFKGSKLNSAVFVYMVIIDYGSDKKDIRTGDVLLLR